MISPKKMPKLEAIKACDITNPKRQASSVAICYISAIPALWENLYFRISLATGSKTHTMIKIALKN